MHTRRSGVHHSSPPTVLHERRFNLRFPEPNLDVWGVTTVDTVTDPVCGMQIDSGEAEVESSYDGIVYYFCSVDCRDRFEENPDAFLEESSLFQRAEDQEVLLDERQSER